MTMNIWSRKQHFSLPKKCKKYKRKKKQGKKTLGNRRTEYKGRTQCMLSRNLKIRDPNYVGKMHGKTLENLKHENGLIKQNVSLVTSCHWIQLIKMQGK